MNAWEDYGLDPLPAMAPPWLPLVGHPRIHLAAYDWQNSVHRVIEGPWAVDIERIPATAGPQTRSPGDIVLYVGRAEGSPDAYVWPPALVVQCGRATDGEQRLVTLTNDELIAVRRRDLPTPLRSRLSKLPGVLSPIIRRKVLALWGLDALCPDCGWIGSPITYGFMLAPGRRWPLSGPSDPGGAAVPGGCDVPANGPQWQCTRCETQWPEGADPIIESLWDLMDLHHCAISGEIDQLIRKEVGVDVNVLIGDENEAGADLGFEVHGAYRSLTYPVYMSEFWDAVYQTCGDGGRPPQGVSPPLYV